MIVIHIF